MYMENGLPQTNTEQVMYPNNQTGAYAQDMRIGPLGAGLIGYGLGYATSGLLTPGPAFGGYGGGYGGFGEYGGYGYGYPGFPGYGTPGYPGIGYPGYGFPGYGFGPGFY